MLPQKVLRRRLLSNIVSVSLWLMCAFYVFVSSDGSLPKEPKGDGSSQIAGKTNTHAVLLHLSILIHCVFGDFNYGSDYSRTLLIFQHPRCDHGVCAVALFNRITHQRFRFYLQSLKKSQGPEKILDFQFPVSSRILIVS